MAELRPTKTKMDTVRDLMTKARPHIEMAMPRHMNVDRLLRISLTSCLRNPRLLECTTASLIGAILECAQLGLEPDDVRGQGYLVPLRNNKKGVMEVQFWPGYMGLMDLSWRSEKVSTIEPVIVYEWDKFEYVRGFEKTIVHAPGKKPTEFYEKRTKEPLFGVSHFYCIVRQRDGGTVFEVMEREEVEWHRDRYSRAAESGPWVTDPGAMGLKTVTKKTLKFVPKSPELARAVALDDLAESGIPQDLPIPFDVEGETESEDKNKTKLENLTDKLRDQQGETKPRSTEKRVSSTRMEEIVKIVERLTLDPASIPSDLTNGEADLIVEAQKDASAVLRLIDQMVKLRINLRKKD